MPMPVIRTHRHAGDAVARCLVEAACAGALSALVLLWRGKRETGSAAAPVNAVSHWLWPRSALRRDEVSAKYTATGTVVHHLASLFWCALYEWLADGRRRPSPTAALRDASAVTALAAVVDLKLVPKRLSPGFEERLSAPSLVLVYAAFAAGMALGGSLGRR